MRPQPKTIVKLAAAATILSAASSALAIGPSYQYVLDNVPAAISTLNDAVSLTQNNNFVGSGQVIGGTIVPYSATQSAAFFTILTANHVAVAGLTTARFGAGPNAIDNAGNNQTYTFNAGLNGAFQTYTLIDPVSNPNNLPEDVSIMQASVVFPTGATPAGVTRLLANLASINTTFGGTTGAQSIGFTQVGYGQGGVWNGTNANTGNAYNGNGIYEARRFQNNTSTSLNAAAIQTYGQYFQPTVRDSVLTPSIAGAGGAGFDGDSGSPWFTAGGNANVTVTPANPNDYNTLVNPAAAPVTEPNGTTVPANSVLNISHSNDESAVFVAGSFIAGKNAIASGSTQLAVPLLDLGQTQLIDIDAENTQSIFQWASGFKNNPVSVPEPTSISLIAVGGFALLRRRRAK